MNPVIAPATFVQLKVPVRRRGVTAADRIRAMVAGLEVVDPAECWRCPGESRTSDGYGLLWHEGRAVRAHRLAYALHRELKDPRGIPTTIAGRRASIDHLCGNRECVNPRHLELVTHQENTLRGDTVTARNAAKDRCPRGHALVGDNLVTRASHPDRRDCKRCKRAHDAARALMLTDRSSRPYGQVVPEADKRGIIAEALDSVGELPNLSPADSASLARALTHAIVRARYDVAAVAK